jgi:hypothetical protein
VRHILTYRKTFLFKPYFAFVFVPVVFALQWLSDFIHLGMSALQTWTLPAFSDPPNMSQDNLVHPVAAAVTTQVKLCPYDEEEAHIWFRLIEAQFAAAGIKSQKLKYANALASLPKQVLWDILDTLGLDGCIVFLKLILSRGITKFQLPPRISPKRLSSPLSVCLNTCSPLLAYQMLLKLFKG